MPVRDMAGAHDPGAPVVHPWRAAPPLRAQSGSQAKMAHCFGNPKNARSMAVYCPGWVGPAPRERESDAILSGSTHRCRKAAPFSFPNDTRRWRAACRPAREFHLPTHRPPSGNRSAGQTRPPPSPPPHAAHRAGMAVTGKARTSRPRAGESRDAERTACVHKIHRAISGTRDVAGDARANARA